jgi:hypothetical protein
MAQTGLMEKMERTARMENQHLKLQQTMVLLVMYQHG